MPDINDFTDTEMWAIQTTLKERYGKDVEVQLADVELRLSPADREITPCPALYWTERSANFVIAKLGDERYYCQFYYRGHEQFGTGRDEWDNLAECVTTLLQLQADHEAKRAGESEGSTEGTTGAATDSS
ncbi:MAG TPA: hypothetical protein ENI80_05005 [Acidiferrobacteraceae bacterium]|nr:hypothetical protein [Acidiferrobacteraceae bacterium]